MAQGVGLNSTPEPIKLAPLLSMIAVCIAKTVKCKIARCIKRIKEGVVIDMKVKINIGGRSAATASLCGVIALCSAAGSG